MLQARGPAQKWETSPGRHSYFHKERTPDSSPQIVHSVHMLRAAACQEEKVTEEIQRCYMFCSWIVICFKHSFTTL